MVLLPELHIENYRLFQEFALEQLAPVNLIGGRNNTGKSTLLEAAYLVASSNPMNALYSVLEERGERLLRDRGLNIGSLFYRYPSTPASPLEICAGQHWFKVRLPYEHELEELMRKYLRPRPDTRDMTRDEVSAEYVEREVGFFLLRIETNKSDSPIDLLLREDGLAFNPRTVLFRPEIPVERAFIIRGTDSVYRRYKEFSKWWDEIALTPRKDIVLEMLRIVEPTVQDIDFLSQDENVKVRVENLETPIYIGSLGDGMRHLLIIALALAKSQNGVLLLDEVETGLHFSTQVPLWRMLFRAAQAFDVQILATTHSSDCITAFARVWEEHGQKMGQYVRLDNVYGTIIPEIYTQDELSRATGRDIETR